MGSIQHHTLQTVFDKETRLLFKTDTDIIKTFFSHIHIIQY